MLMRVDRYFIFLIFLLYFLFNWVVHSSIPKVITWNWFKKCVRISLKLKITSVIFEQIKYIDSQ